MQPLVDEPAGTLQRKRGRQAAARDKHTRAGKLLARERITALLDPGSPFWNCPRWRAPGVCEDLPGAGLITGIAASRARVHGRGRNDPTVKETLLSAHREEACRAQRSGDNELTCGVPGGKRRRLPAESR